MRELKFRAWDAKFKKMIFTGFHVIGEVTVFDGVGQYCFETKGDGPSLARINDIELMQFTGLKDEAGLEIYEGDVLQCGEDGSIREIVEWKENMWTEEGFMTGFGEFCFTSDQYKVIGNIYENKDLIPDK